MSSDASGLETSKLSKIEDTETNPLDLFSKWLHEVKQHRKDNIELMSIATVNKEKAVLNRTVLLRKFDENGFYFVTQRDSRKCKDMKENANVAAVFLWLYNDGSTYISRQVRINGTVEELSNNQIAEFYREEPVFGKIRSKICKCGQPVNWNELKRIHDETLEAYKAGADTLPQTDKYTAFVLKPTDIDFYFAKENEIADRVLYTKADNGKWSTTHIAA